MEALKINQEISNHDLATSVFPETDWPPEFEGQLASTLGPMMKEVLASNLEPMFRKVVAEELDNFKLKNHAIFFGPSLVPQTLALKSTPIYKLIFSEINLSLPIFTGSKILGCDKKPLEIILVNTNYGGSNWIPITLNPPPKVELVVLNGGFPPRGYDDSWTSQQFDDNIVKERNGKPPLLHGDLFFTLKHGVTTIGDMKFTDNSSWIPSRKFKIGARVAPGTIEGCVLEAITEAFVVKEYRMGAFKKHYPPMWDDEVWRLEKIGKDGVFHKKLAAKGISTVKDILNMSANAVDRKKLRGILGSTMSDKMWEMVLKHAKTCKINNNTPHGQSNSADRVQQEIVTEKDALLAQGTARQPYLSYVQANEDVNNFDDEGTASFGMSFDDISQLDF